ncbi:nucleoside triphosphate pyrophosphohydrolase [Mucilaginibacter sp. dw_454]|uniref:nucleoside triphosphate pyrophosphohydrolase n=1 Tax=Mucilaginibacter sp. dw_454 TaxID=2720079 RepID=UPI001BD64C89|nr:nucleoside triphosphate pyrophosphohydrolase [Mucilaginibacter sp. dw_454]
MKLVRDNIPEIISRSGKIPLFHLANEHEIRQLLNEKLLEEVNEFLSAPSEEELADIYEILDAIVGEYNYDSKSISAIKEEKAKTNGSFNKKLILEGIKESDV